jgi:hypothetical protein
VGRPLKFQEPMVPLTVRVPRQEYDRLCREAGRRDLSEYIRDRLVSYTKVDTRPIRP